MDKKFRNFFYIMLVIYISIILVEVNRCVTFTINKRLGNQYLEEFIEKNDYRNNLDIAITSQLRNCLYLLVKNGGYLFLIYLISRLDKLEDSEEQSNVPLSIPDEQQTTRRNFDIHYGDIIETAEIDENNQKVILIENEEHKIKEKPLISKLFLLLDTEEKILLFVSYFYIWVTFLPYFWTLKHIPLLVLGPYIFLKMNMKLYIKYKYAKCFFFSVYMALLALLYGISKNIFKSSVVDNGKSLPKEIYNYFINKGMDLTVERVVSDKVNVGIFAIMKNVFIMIYGDLNILTKKEQTAVFYHEIGHVENKSLMYRMLVSKFVSIVAMLLEILFLKANRTIISDKISKYGRWFLIFICVQMSLLPPLLALNNFYSQLDEFEADKFSSKMIDSKYLASALSKLILHSKSYIDFSVVYSCFYRTHPSLINRLERLGMY
ncbi:Protease HtpX like protein [Nosema granulosis]|uniref:Protease HtpX like protein n=1 Tax=Nosema granulosis TaxID=83296 RepID=A0A9P6GZX2_9MICR|nr:Protease HtpX like protein [Nosema granulosis]